MIDPLSNPVCGPFFSHEDDCIAIVERRLSRLSGVERSIRVTHCKRCGITMTRPLRENEDDYRPPTNAGRSQQGQ